MLTGVAPMNFDARKVTTDSLFWQFKHSAGFRTRYYGPRYDVVNALFDLDDVFYDVQSHMDTTRSFEEIFGMADEGKSKEQILAKFDELTKGVDGAFLNTILLDHQQHHAGRANAPEPIANRKMLNGDMKYLKEWIDSKDGEYLLVLMSDHGSEYPGNLHGPAAGGNENFVLFYSPNLQQLPSATLESNSWIYITDVAATISHYLSNVNIPADSLGLISPRTNDPQERAKLFHRNALQMRELAREPDTRLNWDEKLFRKSVDLRTSGDYVNSEREFVKLILQTVKPAITINLSMSTLAYFSIVACLSFWILNNFDFVDHPPSATPTTKDDTPFSNQGTPIFWKTVFSDFLSHVGFGVFNFSFAMYVLFHYYHENPMFFSFQRDTHVLLAVTVLCSALSYKRHSQKKQPSSLFDLSFLRSWKNDSPSVPIEPEVEMSRILSSQPQLEDSSDQIEVEINPSTPQLSTDEFSISRNDKISISEAKSARVIGWSAVLFLINQIFLNDWLMYVGLLWDWHELPESQHTLQWIYFTVFCVVELVDRIRTDSKSRRRWYTLVCHLALSSFSIFIFSQIRRGEDHEALGRLRHSYYFSLAQFVICFFGPRSFSRALILPLVTLIYPLIENGEMGRTWFLLMIVPTFFAFSFLRMCPGIKGNLRRLIAGLFVCHSIWSYGQMGLGMELTFVNPNIPGLVRPEDDKFLSVSMMMYRRLCPFLLAGACLYRCWERQACHESLRQGETKPNYEPMELSDSRSLLAPTCNCISEEGHLLHHFSAVYLAFMMLFFVCLFGYWYMCTMWTYYRSYTESLFNWVAISSTCGLFTFQVLLRYCYASRDFLSGLSTWWTTWRRLR